MKICVISFDHWNYDKHIVDKLQSKGVEAVHINFGDFKHASFFERVKNAYSKIFFKKNLKKINRQKYILEILENLGTQDQILVINPDLIDKSYHLEIKKHTSRYIAYLYDSIARYPVEHLLDGIFDTVFSFDEDDVRKYGLKKITNYNYLEKKSLSSVASIKYDAFYLASYDNRMPLLYKIAAKLESIGITYLFIVIENKKLKKKITSFVPAKNTSSIIFRKKRIEHDDIGAYYNQANVIFDLVRDNQSGLSFRIFEAMAYQKKIITSNKTIANYDFYNPDNILVIDEENLNFAPAFFTTPYKSIPQDIYNQYTLDHWVDTVFKLKLDNY